MRCIQTSLFIFTSLGPQKYKTWLRTIFNINHYFVLVLSLFLYYLLQIYFTHENIISFFWFPKYTKSIYFSQINWLAKWLFNSVLTKYAISQRYSTLMCQFLDTGFAEEHCAYKHRELWHMMQITILLNNLIFFILFKASENQKAAFLPFFSFLFGEGERSFMDSNVMKN